MRQDSGRSGRAVPCARLPPQKCLKVVKTNVGNSGAKAALSCVVALGFVFAQARVQIASAAQSPQADSRKISASDWSLSVLQPAAVDGKELPPAFAKAVPSSVAELKTIEERVKRLVTQVSPAVVAVEVGFSSGSGVVISKDGLVLTAGHVCGKPNREVRFTFPDGTTAYGKTIGVDTDSDTGLMKITSPGSWPRVSTGTLSQAAVGEWVLALGHPGGFDVQRSLVARLGRIIRLAPGILQTDCTISPGDSGGPLFDMYGRVIAIHSAISSSPADNFHVPITEFSASWTQLVKSETEKQLIRLPKVYLGATVTDGDPGCRVSMVDPGGPASGAGLKPGDLILRVDEREIPVPASFRRWLAESTPGETLTLEVKRGGKVFLLEVKLQPPQRADAGASAKQAQR